MASKWHVPGHFCTFQNANKQNPKILTNFIGWVKIECFQIMWTARFIKINQLLTLRIKDLKKKDFKTTLQWKNKATTIAQMHDSKWSAEVSLGAIVANGTVSLMLRRCDRNWKKRAETWQQIRSHSGWARTMLMLSWKLAKPFLQLRVFNSDKHL